jgi:hypothetical protein
MVKLAPLKLLAPTVPEPTPEWVKVIDSAEAMAASIASAAATTSLVSVLTENIDLSL